MNGRIDFILRRGMLWSVVALACGCASISGSVGAAEWGPQLHAIYPAGGQAGSTVAVEVIGLRFDESTALHFSRPGLTAEAVPVVPIEDDATPGDADRATRLFRVHIAGDTPIGLCDVRVVGANGLSNARAFQIGDRPEVNKLQQNHQAANAQRIPPTCHLVNGRCEDGAADWFTVSLSKGERVVLDCWAWRLDSRLVAELTLFDAAGVELAYGTTGPHWDAILDFTAPATGDYRLRLHDRDFGRPSRPRYNATIERPASGPNPEYSYRLHLRRGPYLDAIFPPQGKAGTEQIYTLYGRNLPQGKPSGVHSADGVELEKMQVAIRLPARAEIAAAARTAFLPAIAFEADLWEYRLTTTDGVSNPLAIRVVDAETTLEQEPNDRPEQAQVVRLPVEIAGQSFGARDRDWFRFEAKQGEVWWIEVFADRLGRPADPVIALQQDGPSPSPPFREKIVDEAILAQHGYLDTATADPSYRFETPHDGEFRLLLRDQFVDSRDDPTAMYALSIRKESPDFRLLAYPGNFPAPARPDPTIASPVLEAGKTTRVEVQVGRRHGFAAPIELTIEGLPAGVECPAVVLKEKETVVQLEFKAAADAVAWHGPLHVVGRSQVNGQDLVRTALTAEVTWAKEKTLPVPLPGRSRLTAALMFSVVPPQQTKD